MHSHQQVAGLCACHHLVGTVACWLPAFALLQSLHMVGFTWWYTSCGLHISGAGQWLLLALSRQACTMASTSLEDEASVGPP